MLVSEKIRTTNNKIKQFWTGEDILPEKDLSKKAATIKRFEY